MLTELLLTLLVAAIPLVMYLFTRLALKMGPNSFVGFRISPKMKNRDLWDAVHQSLVPLLSKQVFLAFGAVPVCLGLFLLPSSFPFLLLSYIAVMFIAIALSLRRALVEIGNHV